MKKTVTDTPIIAYKTFLIRKVDSVDDPENYQSYWSIFDTII